MKINLARKSKNLMATFIPYYQLRLTLFSPMQVLLILMDCLMLINIPFNIKDMRTSMALEMLLMSQQPKHSMLDSTNCTLLGIISLEESMVYNQMLNMTDTLKLFLM